MSSAQKSPTAPSPLMHLPLEVWQQVIQKLHPDDQQAMALACKQVHSMVAASAVTQLSINQRTMVPPLRNLDTLPAAFTAVRHLTLDLSVFGELSNQPLSFLQSFPQHGSRILSSLATLTLKTPAEHSVVEPVAQLLGSCHSLSTLVLDPVDEGSVTLREPSPGAGLHHLSHCLLQCVSGHPRFLKILSSSMVGQHVVSLNVDSSVRNQDVLFGRLDHFPALQDLSVESFPLNNPKALSALPTLTSLTRLHIPRLAFVAHPAPAEPLHQLLHQSIPSLALLKDLEIRADDTLGTSANSFTLPLSWSSLQQLTSLSLQHFHVTQHSGLWHLTRLDTLCLHKCVITPSAKFNALVGLRHLQLRCMSGADVSPPGANFFPDTLTSLHLQTTQSDDDYEPSDDDETSSRARCELWLARTAGLAGTLRTLSLRCGPLSASSLDLIIQLTSLQQLQLSYASAEPDRAGDIDFQVLASMTQLTSLALEDRYGDELDVAPMDRLPPHVDLQGMTHLQQLTLQGLWSLATVKGVPSSLTSLSSPVILSDPAQATMPLPESLRHCASLSSLTIGDHLQKISDPNHTLGHLTSLQSLDLCVVDPSIPATMSPMPFLTELCMMLPRGGGTRVPSPAWLQHSTILRSLTLHDVDSFPPTLPATLTRLDIELSNHGEVYAFPEHWHCGRLRTLRAIAPSGLSGVTTLAALTSLERLHVEGMADPRLDPLDVLSLLKCLWVVPMRGCRVTYWLPTLKAFKSQDRMSMLLFLSPGCEEEPPPGHLSTEG